jgi:hypothetical protein
MVFIESQCIAHFICFHCSVLLITNRLTSLTPLCSHLIQSPVLQRSAILQLNRRLSKFQQTPYLTRTAKRRRVIPIILNTSLLALNHHPLKLLSPSTRLLLDMQR